MAGELRTLTDVEDFQRWSSCDGLIRRIGAGFHFPLLMLNALDDPLVPHYLTQYCRLLLLSTLVRPVPLGLRCFGLRCGLFTTAWLLLALCD